MRTFILALVLGCCLAGTAAAKDLNFFHGSYDLADGRLLTVNQHHGKLYLQIDSGSEVEVRALGDGVFVSLDGGLRATFDRYPNGVVAGVQLVLAQVK
jgi:hypothetical protein